MRIMMMIYLMPVVMLLSMTALPTIKAAGRTPTAYVTSGGGFKTMTTSMGIIRAWDESNILQLNTTHSGCVSGGCWFQLQFTYSKDFYESALGLNGDSVTEFLSKWGKRYEKAMKEATNEKNLKKLDFSLATSSSKACLLTKDKKATQAIEGGVNYILDKCEFPANNWYLYVEAMLGSYITNYNTSLFSAKREGFANTILVAGSTLGPDVYDNDPTKTLTLSGQPKDITLLPISFVASDGSAGEWQYTAAESPLKVSSGRGFSKKTAKFKLLPAPLINVVASAASAAGGILGSPTLLSNIINNFLKIKLNTTDSVARKALLFAIDACLPLGLEDISSPTEGNVPSTVSPWNPFYRYMDGQYTENSAVAHTIANMQKSCIDDPSNYDCTEGLRLLEIFTSHTSLGNIVTIKRLFANCDCGNSNSYLGSELGMAPNPQLFAEDFPSDLNGPGWMKYSTKTFNPFKKNATSSISYAWRGNVTTVSNKAYGITAGMNVDLIVLFATLPPREIIILPGAVAQFPFSHIYAHVAEEQYKSTLLLFQKWKLSEQWGTGSTITTRSDHSAKIMYGVVMILIATMLCLLKMMMMMMKKKNNNNNNNKPKKTQ